MDNKLRSVVQFAFYTLFFALSNNKQLLIFPFNYIVLVILFLTCLYSMYELHQVEKRCGESEKTTLRLNQFLNFALITEIFLILKNSEKNPEDDNFLLFDEFLCQATIFYLWLDVFQKYFHLQDEKEKKDVKKIHPIQIIKVCFIFTYALNSFYQVYNKINKQAREYQIELGLELFYAIIFLYYYGAFYKIYQINSVTSSNDIKSHDPFDEETIESSNSEEDEKFFDYFRFSIICCLSLVVNTIFKVLDYNRTNQSFIKQSGIIIVYMFFISNQIPTLNNEKPNIERKKLVEMENRASPELEQL